ncbi:MAG: addiction module toxin RelE [Spirochaetaceae bacterium]|jgi:mRNA interferase RelE/StbE|nr:addiction module toxin RelE [Spirochaetaceae bacterium]
MFEIAWNDKSRKEYDALDGSELVFVDKALNRIRISGMQAGKALHGNLSSCRKLKHKKMGLRIVFRESSQGIEIIEIVAIGKRAKFKVYKDAEDRL